jgi:PPOX class probable F420-dependent enzyme
MPRLPLTPEVEEFLQKPNPAVVATLRPDGSPHSVPTWYAWEDGLVLLNMDESRARLDHLRRDPRVSLTVLDGDDWYHHVSLRGNVLRIEEDRDLAGIDRLSQRYRGQPYRNRERKRFNAWMQVERWDAW